MNQTVSKQPLTTNAVVPLARLSGPHGYRFDGDRVHLHTRFAIMHDAAHQHDWALQLWACASAPTSSKSLSGHVVAEVALPPMSEVADETEQVDMDTFANPPAGGAHHIMVLVLTSGRPGQFDEVHDVVVYPQSQRFLQPRMRGSVDYRIEGNRVHFSVEHIENTRDAANVSGTLALELWALAKPYTGGTFQGVPLAGVVIGSLTGQTESKLTSFDLPFTRPADGVWHFVLMLREWTAAGYVTRDYTNFLQAVTYASAAPAKIVPNKPTRPLAASTSALISINTGSDAQLCAIEGLNPKLVTSIIKKRPFASLDDLRRIKGISAKLLAAIRSRLTV